MKTKRRVRFAARRPKQESTAPNESQTSKQLIPSLPPNQLNHGSNLMATIVIHVNSCMPRVHENCASMLLIESFIQNSLKQKKVSKDFKSEPATRSASCL
ncbi:unnamed protein product [Prunus brigantina]